MTETISSSSGWERDPRTGGWCHPAHGTIERVGNRWRVAGTTRFFYLIREAQAHAEELTKNRKPEQFELF
ncbi:MAG TPA: hypothetical protein VGB07_23530 [Blastocatellia bacterium]